MPIVVNSPFSGKPVKIRDQDIGRAVRDEEGRIFYVLPRQDGSGYYSSPTRTANAKDEARYLEMAGKMDQAQVAGREQSELQVHDAMGRRRSNVRGKLVILLLLLIVLALAWLFRPGGPFHWSSFTRPATPPPPAQHPVDPAREPPAEPVSRGALVIVELVVC